MEGVAPRPLVDRGYTAGLIGVLVVAAAAVAIQVVTGEYVYLVTVLAAAFLVACMLRLHGLWGTMAFIVLVVAIPFASEFAGVLTGFPYGPYAYLDAPRPWVLNLVPVFILIAWIYIGYMAIATTTLGLGRSALWLAPVDGLVATAWDLMVDPLAVRAHWWVWTDPVGLYGVPLSNFLGWFLVVTLLSLAVRWAWAHDVRAPTRTSRNVVAMVPVLLLASAVQFGAAALANGFTVSGVIGLTVLVASVSVAWDRLRRLPRAPSTASPWVPAAVTAARLRAEEPQGRT